MTFAGLLGSCFGSSSPSRSEESLSSNGPRSAEATAYASSLATRSKDKSSYPEHAKLRPTSPVSAFSGCKSSLPPTRSSTDDPCRGDSSCSTPSSTQSLIQRVLIAANISPSNDGPLSTLSNASMHAICDGLDVPLGVVVFEDAVHRGMYSPQQSSGLTGCGASFEMQPDLWQFQFKVRCIFVNSAHAQALECSSCEKAMSHISASVNKNTALRCDLLGLLKGIEHGQRQSVQTWNTYYNKGQHPELFSLWMQPCLWVAADGSKFIACLMCLEPPPSQQAILTAMGPDHSCLECIPSSITTVNQDGFICSQNAAAKASFGVSLSSSKDHGLNFLQELFHGHYDLHAKMQRHLKAANSFHVCVQLLSPLLREWLNLEQGEEVWHQLYITRIASSSPTSPAYVIVQTDITDKVLAERKVQLLQLQHQGLLREILPPEVMEAILQSKCMVTASAACGRQGRSPGIDGHDLASCLDAADTDTEDSEQAPRPCSQQQLGGIRRGRRPSQLVLGSNSQLNTQLSSLDISLHSKTPSLQDMKGVWLTQQDVQNLATNHESVTILFADIKGFTALSQQLHPAEVMLFLNQLYSIWDAMLDAYGVYKVETIGDSYMVAGGLFSTDPASKLQKLGGYDPRHAQKVLDFGRAMLESASLVLDPRGEPVQIRIGIHSGACVSGIVGQRMPRFCLFGDTINTASRMESNCPRPGCIHASEASHALLAHEPWMPTGGVFCKGKGVMQSYYIPVTADMSPPADSDKLPHVPASPAESSLVSTSTHCTVSTSNPQTTACFTPKLSSFSEVTSDAEPCSTPRPSPQDDRAQPPTHEEDPEQAAKASHSLCFAKGLATQSSATLNTGMWLPQNAAGQPQSAFSAAEHRDPTALKVRAHITAHVGSLSALERSTPASSPMVLCSNQPGGAASCEPPSLMQYQAASQSASDAVDQQRCSDGEPYVAGCRRPNSHDVSGFMRPNSSDELVTASCARIVTVTSSPCAQPSPSSSMPMQVPVAVHSSALYADALLTPVTPGQSSSRFGNWKSMVSYDGRGLAGQQASSAAAEAEAQAPTSMPRRSKITEQAQRVLQELNQSRPKPRELIQTMKSAKGVGFDTRRGSGSDAVQLRCSMDLSRVSSADGAAMRRGSLDMAWASVNKFRRSHPPPAALQEDAVASSLQI